MTMVMVALVRIKACCSGDAIIASLSPGPPGFQTRHHKQISCRNNNNVLFQHKWTLWSVWFQLCEIYLSAVFPFISLLQLITFLVLLPSIYCSLILYIPPPCPNRKERGKNDTRMGKGQFWTMCWQPCMGSCKRNAFHTQIIALHFA